MIKLMFCLFVQRLQVLSLGQVYFPFLIKVRCRTEKLNRYAGGEKEAASFAPSPLLSHLLSPPSNLKTSNNYFDD